MRAHCLTVLALLAFFPLADAVVANDAAQEAFVRVSPRDTRYFELTNGEPYIPIGLNMIAPPGRGLTGMEQWFEKLEAQGGNFARIWLGNRFFELEETKSGEFSEEKARRIDGLLEIAARHGIRVKLCIESFRHLGEGRQAWAAKPVHHVSSGGPATSTVDFFDNPRCREHFKRKLAWLAERYGSNPAVFGWELWNEMDAIAAGDWHSWTEEMLPELERLFPQNLVMQSLGSYDREDKRPRYRQLCTIPENDVLQVHRYLDLGAQWEVCHGPVDLLAAQAVRELIAFGVTKPVLLAESGAVEPNHSGPFSLYGKDREGILLHDVLFAPFFAGAAGPGHIWHWDVYVDRNDLWRHFGRFATAIRGIDPASEGFQPREISHPRLRVLTLSGRNTLLAWCRDREATWRTELAEGRPPKPIDGATLRLPLGDDWVGAEVQVYSPWRDSWAQVSHRNNEIMLPSFTRSLVVRVERKQPGVDPTNDGKK